MSSADDVIDRVFRRTMDAKVTGVSFSLSDAEFEALEHAVDAASGEALARGVVALVNPMLSRGGLADLGPLLRGALEHAEDVATTTWLRVNLAQVHYCCGAHELALATLGEVASPYADEVAGYAFDYARSNAFRGLRRYDDALAVLRTARERARSNLAHYAVALLWNGELNTLHRMNRLDEAIEQSHQLLHHVKLFLRDNVALLNAVSNTLPATLLAARRFGEAVLHYNSYLSTSVADTPDPHGRCVATQNLCAAYLLMGDLENATRVSQEARQLVHDGFWRGGTALQDLIHGSLHLFRGEYVEAICELENAAAAAQVENRADLLMVARCVIACARHGSGDTTARLPDGVLPDQPYVSQPAWDQLKRGLSREAVLRPAALNRLEQQLFAIVQARSLAVRSDFSAFSVDGGQTWTSLKRRVAARAVLTALAEAFPNSVDAWSLFEEAWPDEIVHDANVINKLYTTIHRMRALGLDDFIATRGDGYVLNGAVQLVESKL